MLLTVPLYVDGIPSHVIAFLQEAEKFCMENSCHFSFYVISNHGFIEGIHNKVHLKMYECWCKRSCVTWGGGIGIGGGEMLHILSIIYPIVFAVMILINFIRYAMGTPVTCSDWMPCIKNLAIYLFFSYWRYLLYGTIGRKYTKGAENKKPVYPCHGSGLFIHPNAIALIALCRSVFARPNPYIEPSCVNRTVKLESVFIW